MEVARNVAFYKLGAWIWEERGQYVNEERKHVSLERREWQTGKRDRYVNYMNVSAIKEGNGPYLLSSSTWIVYFVKNRLREKLSPTKSICSSPAAERS